MTADQLLLRVPPPPKPAFAAGRLDFERAEALLGLVLPADYKDIVSAYGDGCWQGFWYILNPASPNRNLNLVAQASLGAHSDWGILAAERLGNELAAKSLPLWPDPGGMLPWALTDNGGRFFWVTRGPSARWRTIYYPDRSPEFVDLASSTADIVLGAVTGALPIFSEEFGADHVYDPASSFRRTAS